MTKLLVSDAIVIEPTEPGAKKPNLQRWFVLPGPPKEWKFVFIDDEELANLIGSECHAYTDPDSGLVLFCSSLKARKRRETLRVVFLHELIHVGLGTDGAINSVQQAFGTRNGDLAGQREEAVAGLWSNNMAAALFASGLMKLPRIPGRG